MSRTTFYQAKYINWPPVRITEYAEPDSPYWQEQAEIALDLFDRKAPEFLSDPDCARFNDLVLTHYGEHLTWKETYECYRKAREALCPGATVERLAFAAGVLPEGVEA